VEEGMITMMGIVIRVMVMIMVWRSWSMIQNLNSKRGWRGKEGIW
jgi:hypothetical protein